ncbi:M24 family metallopeptidase [Rossellomorea vietnamensis]|uniref:M24 family metallopeptidase n=1 Tax=Rossellomorea vietnamensis TaxID=218284 RepID=UPI00077C1C94|nr:Xaa-Pro peptidase family protein [Rossellomorea vietnamensis]
MNRIEKVQKKLAILGAHGILITKDVNRMYVTGFTGTAGVILVTKEEAVLFTDFRYDEQAKKEAVNARVVIHQGNIIKEVSDLIKQLGLPSLLIEENSISFKTYAELQEQSNVELRGSNLLVERIREIKEPGEVEKLSRAAEIADATFSKVIDFIRPGITEIDIKNKLEFTMRELGATSSSFNMIVASGVRAALPHGIASSKVIAEGDMVTLDFGALYDGYCSDITRTVSIGRPKEQFKEIFDIVHEALLRATKEVSPQTPANYIDFLTRSLIEKHGYGENFGHSTGHGLGMEVHEPLRVSKESEEVLQKGMVITIEPGIYIPGFGGCRIEDDILVTEDGYLSLTQAPRDLIIL